MTEKRLSKIKEWDIKKNEMEKVILMNIAWKESQCRTF